MNTLIFLKQTGISNKLLTNVRPSRPSKSLLVKAKLTLNHLFNGNKQLFNTV